MPRPSGHALARSILTLVAVFAVVASVASAARASHLVTADKEPPVAASVTDVTVEHGQLHGLLTVSMPGKSVSIDTDSVRARLGDAAPLAPSVAPVGHERRSVMLVLDVSGSMGKSGIAAASAAARAFLQQAPSDVEVGLVAFAENVRVVRPTTDRAEVSSALQTLRPQGETALYDGLRRALTALPGQGSRTVLLLSDGGDTVSDSTLGDVVGRIRRQDVRLDAVSFRTKESDNRALRSLSAAGHGRVLEVADEVALTRAFRGAARALHGQLHISMPVSSKVAGDQLLRVRGSADGMSFAVRERVQMPNMVGSPASTAATSSAETEVDLPVERAAPSLFASSTWAIGIATLVFVGLLGVGLAVASPLFVSAHRRRLRALDQFVGTSVQQSRAGPTDSGSAIMRRLLTLADAWAKRRRSSARTALLLERADMRLRINEWYVLRFVAVIGAFVIFWVFWHGSSFGYLGARLMSILVGLLAPTAYLKIRAAMRARKFEAQLPDVLTLVASSLSTGFSLAQSVDAITRDAAEPSAKEFARALAETRIGADIEDSLDRVAMRMDSTNLKWTVMAIRIQRQVGGNLAETLRTTAATLRDRQALKRQVSALSAEGKLSAYILIALPFALFGYMMLVSRDYVSLLWTSVLGLALLSAGALSMVIGILWMRKVVVVEV